jgi:signal transduction histidine kinase
VSAALLTLDELRQIDLFDGIDDEQLEQWLPVVELRDVPAGEVLIEQGTTPEGVMLLLEGTAEAQIVEGERTEPVGRQLAPTWIAAIAVLTNGPLGVRMQTLTSCRVGVIPADDFRRLAFAQPAVHQTVMQRVGPVMSRVTSIEQNRERLAALGTMAAGLAHELNNPAAAAQRTAAQLAEALDVANAAFHTFVDVGLGRDGAAQLIELHDQAVTRAAGRSKLDALDAADAEDELRDRLEELGASEPWRLAEPLAAAGVDDDWLTRVSTIAGEATDAALQWVAATLTAHSLAAELRESTERMSALVSAVKSYAYMDRGDLVEIDLHEGLETTLAVLGHKLKHTSIEVVRDYDRGLPRLTVRGSELNQVWTNLLDNAIDALGDRGTISIATRRDGDCAIVSISDDGPGIPEETKQHIFDPFFTTKDVGRGTGLGLATARRIVVDRHAGSLAVRSQPGSTTFDVRLPFTQRKA